MDFGKFMKLMGAGRRNCNHGLHSFAKAREIALEYSLPGNRIVGFLLEMGAKCDCQIVCLNISNDWLWQQWELSLRGVLNRLNGKPFFIRPKGTETMSGRKVRLEGEI